VPKKNPMPNDPRLPTETFPLMTTGPVGETASKHAPGSIIKFPFSVNDDPGGT
jgi:hypothetical protein